MYLCMNSRSYHFKSCSWIGKMFDIFFLRHIFNRESFLSFFFLLYLWLFVGGAGIFRWRQTFSSWSAKSPILKEKRNSFVLPLHDRGEDKKKKSSFIWNGFFTKFCVCPETKLLNSILFKHFFLNRSMYWHQNQTLLYFSQERHVFTYFVQFWKKKNEPN